MRYGDLQNEIMSEYDGAEKMSMFYKALLLEFSETFKNYSIVVDIVKFRDSCFTVALFLSFAENGKTNIYSHMRNLM